MEKNLFQPLQEAWLARWNQRIDLAMQSLADIQSSAGWNDWNINVLFSLPRAQREVYTEALLLKSSLLRAHGQIRQSSAMLRKILLAHEQASEPRGFRLLFELGLDYWIDQNLASALDAFLLAERKSRTAEENVFCLANILWCLESLDLERSQAEERLKQAMDQIPESSKISHVIEQFEAYKLRREFFHNLSLPVKTFEAKGQSSFFLLWARALPYVKGQTSTTTEHWASHLWQSSYRSRTLSGIWAPGDRSTVRLGDAIDRLYLWTWLWMAKHPAITLEKLQFTLESVIENLDVESEGKENLLLLRNALAWLFLLEPSIGRNLKRLSSFLARIQASNYPLLETEFFLIQRLSSDSHHSDLDKLTRRFSVFEKIAQQTQNSKEHHPLLPRLYERLSPILIGRDHSYKLIVDYLRSEIRVPALNEAIHSPKLSNLILHLQQSPQVPFALLLDAQTDPRSIHNLVARLRKLTSTDALSIRRNEVIRGQNWPKTLILHAEPKPSYALKDLSITSVKHRYADSDAHLQAAKALLPKSFTRKELEKHLRVSKATACRMIEAWLKTKKLRTEGKARSIVYFWILHKERTTEKELAV